MKFTRRFAIGITTAVALLALQGTAQAEVEKVTIAVGGKSLFYYLPLTIAEQRGYFKEEGVNVEIVDFAGGSKALQAVVGGSADVVSGAYEHTIKLQGKNSISRPLCSKRGPLKLCWLSRPRRCPTTKPLLI